VRRANSGCLPRLVFLGDLAGDPSVNCVATVQFEKLTSGTGTIKVYCEVAAFADEKAQSTSQVAA
jgi:hypothetical protein